MKWVFIAILTGFEYQEYWSVFYANLKGFEYQPLWGTIRFMDTFTSISERILGKFKFTGIPECTACKFKWVLMAIQIGFEHKEDRSVHIRPSPVKPGLHVQV